MQPGETITPGGGDQAGQQPSQPAVPQQPLPPQSQDVELPPIAQAVPEVEQAAPLPAATPVPQAFVDEPATDYDEAPYGPTQEPASLDDVQMQWTASEFIEHQKSPVWYGALMGIGVAGAAICYFLTKDLISSIMLVVIAGVFGFLASRRPRTMSYEIVDGGITVNQRYHDFREFRAFAVVDEGALSSVVLLPLKRFAQSVTLFCPPEIEEDVFGHIGDHLPFLENYSDPFEHLLRRIRF